MNKYVVFTDFEDNVLSLKQFDVVADSVDHAREIIAKTLKSDYNKRIDVDYRILDVVYISEYKSVLSNNLPKYDPNMTFKSRSRKTTN